MPAEGENSDLVWPEGAKVRYGAAYVQETEAAYAEQARVRQEKQLQRRARELGDELHRIEAQAQAALE